MALARGVAESTGYKDEARNERLRRLPFGRLGVEEDMIGPAIFLATDESDWVNGSILYAVSGYTHAAVTGARTRAEVPWKRKARRISKKPPVRPAKHG